VSCSEPGPCNRQTDRQTDILYTWCHNNTVLYTKVHLVIKTAEPIEMPFGISSWVGPRKHIYSMGVHIPVQRATFRGKDTPGHARRHSAEAWTVIFCKAWQLQVTCILQCYAPYRIPMIATMNMAQKDRPRLRVYPWARPVYTSRKRSLSTAVTVRVQFTARVDGPCTRPCTRSCTRPCSRTRPYTGTRVMYMALST